MAAELGVVGVVVVWLPVLTGVDWVSAAGGLGVVVLLVGGVGGLGSLAVVVGRPGVATSRRALRDCSGEGLGWRLRLRCRRFLVVRRPLPSISTVYWWNCSTSVMMPVLSHLPG